MPSRSATLTREEFIEMNNEFWSHISRANRMRDTVLVVQFAGVIALLILQLVVGANHWLPDEIMTWWVALIVVWCVLFLFVMRIVNIKLKQEFEAYKDKWFGPRESHHAQQEPTGT